MLTQTEQPEQIEHRGAVTAEYFSPTGTTGRVVSRIAEVLSAAGGADAAPVVRDITSPDARGAQGLTLGEGEILVFGVPVYAGRVPRLLLEHIAALQGNGALAVAVVVYGNRHYDDALLELADLLEARGLLVVGAAAFIGEHSYSRELARGRPDADDLALAGGFAIEVWRKIAGAAPLSRVTPPGSRPYKVLPVWRDKQGERIDPSRARPQASSACQQCLACVDVCPTGAIDPDDVTTSGAACIRCNACVKVCPSEARSFSDAHYLVAKRWLEAHCTERRSPELFV